MGFNICVVIELLKYLGLFSFYFIFNFQFLLHEMQCSVSVRCRPIMNLKKKKIDFFNFSLKKNSAANSIEID